MSNLSRFDTNYKIPFLNLYPILNGTVSRLSLERKTGQLFATILVWDLPFKVGLAFQQGKEHTLFPGKTIFIRYRFDQVKWI